MIHLHMVTYGFLVLIRFYMATYSFSMIHPDEFFQSQEVMAHSILQSKDPVLASQLHIPWEYHLPTPNRSILFPALIAGFPYKIMKWLDLSIHGYLLLVIPRLVLCFLSFGIDGLLFYCAKALRVSNPSTVVLSFASSWTTWIFLTRPFSNTFETILLLCSITTLLCWNPHHSFLSIFHTQTLVLGSFLAIGCFIRFTFLFFFFPLGIELIRQQDQFGTQRWMKKHSTTWKLFPRLISTGWILLQGLIAFLTWSIVIVLIDTFYFHSNFTPLVIAPWNNLIYNLQYENLQLHGLHPRWTHAIVNMMLLFGPLYLVFLSNHLIPPIQTNRLWSLSCVLFPLLLLSMAPHQEPRFLLPLLIPLHLFTTFPRWYPWISIVFNIVLAIFFGMVHQGGVIPFLLAWNQTVIPFSFLQTSTCQFQTSISTLLSTPLIFYKTYMPPRFLLAKDQPYTKAFRVIDLAGTSLTKEEWITLTDTSDTDQMILITPASVNHEWYGPSTRIGTCGPHLSTEDIDLLQPFQLHLYLIGKNQTIHS